MTIYSRCAECGFAAEKADLMEMRVFGKTERFCSDRCWQYFTNSEPWTFDEWFEGQHGKRPDPIDENLLRDSIDAQSRILANQRELLARIERWEALRNTAMYAWRVKDSKKQANR